jgi:MFS family permease
MSGRFQALVSPLAQRECRALFGAQLISGLGDWAGRLALAVIVFDRSGSALWTAAVTLVALIPWLWPGQMLSTLADRFGRTQVMIAADLVRAALFMVMAAPLPIGVVLALAFLAGLCVPPFVAARGAALVDIVPADRYGKVLALFGVTSQAEIVVGYALGGVVIALVGAPVSLVVNAATFVISALLVASIGSTAASDRHGEAPLGLTGVREGLSVWKSDPICRRALLLFVGVNMTMVLPEALIVPFADEMNAPPATVGLLAASIAVGAMIAMALAPTGEDPIALLHRTAFRAMLLAIATSVLFVFSVRMSVSWFLVLAVAALFLSGTVDAISVPTNQVVGARLPRDSRAAAMSIAGGAQYGSQAITIGVGGAIAVTTGTGWVLAAGALVAAAVCALSLVIPIREPAEQREFDRSPSMQD